MKLTAAPAAAAIALLATSSIASASSSTCSQIAHDVALLEQYSTSPEHLCKFYLSGSRSAAIAPLPGMTPSLFASACECYLESKDDTVPKVDSATPSHVPATFRASCNVTAVNSVKKALKSPTQFCKWAPSIAQKGSPISGMTLLQVLNGCACISHPASSAKTTSQPTPKEDSRPNPKTTSRKSSTTKAKSTSKTTAKAAIATSKKPSTVKSSSSKATIKGDQGKTSKTTVITPTITSTIMITIKSTITSTTTITDSTSASTDMSMAATASSS